MVFQDALPEWVWDRFGPLTPGFSRDPAGAAQGYRVYRVLRTAIASTARRSGVVSQRRRARRDREGEGAGIRVCRNARQP